MKALIGITTGPAGISVVTAIPGAVPDPRPSYRIGRPPLSTLRVVRIERWPPGKAHDLARELVRRITPNPVIEDPECDAGLIRLAVDASDLIAATHLCRELRRTLAPFEGRTAIRALAFTSGAGSPSRLDWRVGFPLGRAVAELASLLAENRLHVDRGDLTALREELRTQLREGTKPRRGVNQEDALGDLAIAALAAVLLFRNHESAGEAGWVPVRWTA